MSDSRRRAAIYRRDDFHEEMALFAPKSTISTSQYLIPPPVPTTRRATIHPELRTPQDDVDDFLSSDLELSFASTMSLNSPSDDASHIPMDVSPSPGPLQSNPIKPARPRSHTTTDRMFGRDMANSPLPQDTSKLMVPTPNSGSSSLSRRRTQRSALPMAWMMMPSSPSPGQSFAHSDNEGDAMDIDMESPATAPPHASSFVVPSKSTSAMDNLFYETMSPGAGFGESPCPPQPKKRRSHSPAVAHPSPAIVESSPLPPSSPSQRKFERFASTGLGVGPLFPSRSTKSVLEGLGTPANPQKRRRPALSTVLANAGEPTESQSAFPVPLVSPSQPLQSQGLPPPRRAFSAMISGNPLGNLSGDSSDDQSFGLDNESPAQAYAQRQNVKAIRRCDGTDDFRPRTGVTAMVERDSPNLNHGLPGFGDNEAQGKVLPCHRVKDDGLMRINSRTAVELLDGRYGSVVSDFMIIDCRFDYEYIGGHIPGAININTTSALEALLLSDRIPSPSASSDGSKKTVLVFHCEFSAKRAPTFAKHLRSKDRALNNHLYPKIHYPELYILEGGYSQFFKDFGVRCEPPAYVPMDDPNHLASRREDLGQFRKAHFGRTRSYAYGELVGKSILAAKLSKRNTAPAGNALFTAAKGSLATLDEDIAGSLQTDEEDDDIGDSPCPPPTKAGSKKLGRGSLTRAETLAALPAR